MTKMGVAKEDRVKVKLACYKLVAGLNLNRRQQEIMGRFVESYVKLRGERQLEFDANIEREFGKRERKKVMEVKEIFREVFEYYAKVDGEVAMLLNSLTHKLGPLTQQIESHIDELEDEDRKALGRVMFEFNTIQDLQDWLAQHPV